MTKSEVNGLNSTVRHIILFALLCLVSCKDEEIIIPDHVIPQEDFSTIMADITLIQAMKNLNATKEMIASDSISTYYSSVWEEHGITEGEFKTTFEFYSEHPDMMASIYKESARQLKQLEKEADEAIEQDRKSKDNDLDPTSTVNRTERKKEGSLGPGGKNGPTDR